MPVRYYTIPPPSDLATFVKFFWVLESDRPCYLHHGMADVNPEMVFHYKGQFDQLSRDSVWERSFTAGIQGQTEHTNRFRTHEPFGIFGVYLFPYTIPMLFGIPSIHLTNQLVDLQSLLGKAGCVLEDKMIGATSNEERITIITSFLKNRLKKADPCESAVTSSIHFIMRNKGVVKVEDVAQEACLSERQFERKFKATVGMNPKLFSRIVRFSTAIKELKVNTNTTLTEIAFHCGYYDQSHFIRDFKLFSGVHPGTFFNGKAEGLDWMNG